MQLEEVTTSLFSFAGHAIHLVGQIIFPLPLGDGLTRRTIMALFLVEDAPSAYNVILGRPCLSTFMMVAYPLQQKLKFSVRCLMGKV